MRFFVRKYTDVDIPEGLERDSNLVVEFKTVGHRECEVLSYLAPL
jgi:hypothetical protein